MDLQLKNVNIPYYNGVCLKQNLKVKNVLMFKKRLCFVKGFTNTSIGFEFRYGYNFHCGFSAEIQLLFSFIYKSKVDGGEYERKWEVSRYVYGKIYNIKYHILKNVINYIEFSLSVSNKG